MEPEEMLDAIRLHGEDGISFVTVHCGVTLSALERLGQITRVCGIVSRGGSFLARWMRANNKENPLFERYDEVSGYLQEVRNGPQPWRRSQAWGIADSLDQAQVDEVVTLGHCFERQEQRCPGHN